MDRSSLLSATLALFCVFALGTAAATLDTTLATDPDDVLDLDWEQLPLSTDEAENVKNEIESNERSSQGPTAQAPSSASGNDRGPSGSDGESLGPADGLGESIGGSGVTEAMAGMGGEESLANKLLDLLPLLLAGLALLVATYLLYRYRHRLKAFGWRLLGVVLAFLPTSRESARSSSASAAEYDPEHAVDEAWLRLVRELSLEPIRNRTPKEVASIAKSNGMAPGAIDRLTRTFEEVRYGGKPVNDERTRRVRRELGELGIRGRSM